MKIHWFLLQTEGLCPLKIPKVKPSPPCKAVWKGALARCLGHEDRALMSGIGAIVRDSQRSLSSLLTQTQQEGSL